MRLFLLCLGLIYGSQMFVDTEFVKPRVHPAADAQTEAQPAWIGESARSVTVAPID